MQLNNVLKGLLIALPILTMTACSSTDDAADSAKTNQTNNQGGMGSDYDLTVVSPIDGSNSQFNEGQLTEQQLAAQRLAEKMRNESQTIYFAYDAATIASDFEPILASHAQYLNNNRNVKVTIEGHADERGTPEYNIALGERRAQAVARYLQALGVQANQISLVSYGEEKPVLFGQSEDNYAKNRRAVLSY